MRLYHKKLFEPAFLWYISIMNKNEDLLTPFILALIIIVAVGAGYWYLNHSFKGKLYADKKAGFSIMFPLNWKIDENPNPNITVQATNPSQTDKVNMNIIIKPLPSELNGQKDEEILKTLTTENMYKKDSIIASGQIIINSNTAVWSQVYLDYPNEKQTLHVIAYQVWTVHHKKLCAITATALGKSKNDVEAVFSKYEKTIRGSIQTLKFLN
jgi:hypothetical protein